MTKRSPPAVPRISISRLTGRYIASEPAVRYCLQRGLINFNSLARLICSTYGIESVQAVSISLRRYANRFRTRDESVSEVIENSDTRITEEKASHG